MEALLGLLTAVSSRSNNESNCALEMLVFVAGECLEDASEWVGGRPIEGIFKLCVAADGEEFAFQAQFSRPADGICRRLALLLVQPVQPAVGILSIEMPFDESAKLAGEATRQTQGGSVAAELQRQREAPMITLVDSNEGLVHVEWTPLVCRRHTEGDAHGQILSMTENEIQGYHLLG